MCRKIRSASRGKTQRHCQLRQPSCITVARCPLNFAQVCSNAFWSSPAVRSIIAAAVQPNCSARIRGNASECQVWLRNLDNDGELFVVLFNNGMGSCSGAGNSTMSVSWGEIGLPSECMVSTTNLITNEYFGTIEGPVEVSLRVGASAALRMHPHC